MWLPGGVPGLLAISCDLLGEGRLVSTAARTRRGDFGGDGETGRTVSDMSALMAAFLALTRSRKSFSMFVSSLSRFPDLAPAHGSVTEEEACTSDMEGSKLTEGIFAKGGEMSQP